MAKSRTWEEKLDEAWNNLPLTHILAVLILLAAAAYLLYPETVTTYLNEVMHALKGYALHPDPCSIGILILISAYVVYRGITRKHREAERKVSETHEITQKIIDKRPHSTFDKDGNLVKMQ